MCIRDSNPGGIRAGLPGGPVRLRDLHDVLPFGDTLVTADMTGRQIAGILMRGVGHGGRGLPQFYGLTAWAWRDGEGTLDVYKRQAQEQKKEKGRHRR